MSEWLSTVHDCACAHDHVETLDVFNLSLTYRENLEMLTFEPFEDLTFFFRLEGVNELIIDVNALHDRACVKRQKSRNLRQIYSQFNI